jgi:hypothetical protein
MLHAFCIVYIIIAGSIKSTMQIIILMRRKTMNVRRLALALGIVSAALCTPAHAGLTTFFGEDLNGPPQNDPNALASHPISTAAQTSFLSNLQGVGTETFEALSGAPPLALTFAGAGTATLSGGSGIQSGNDGVGRYPISGNNYYYAGSNNFNLSFSAPIAAFGFYGVDIGDYGANLTLSLTDKNGVVSSLGVPLTLGSNGNTSGSIIYFGFYDTAMEYTAISFTNSSGGGDNFGFDDMTIGSLQQVHPTPEPATMSLFAVGMAGLGAALRRRSKSC